MFKLKNLFKFLLVIVFMLVMLPLSVIVGALGGIGAGVIANIQIAAKVAKALFMRKEVVHG